MYLCGLYANVVVVVVKQSTFLGIFQLVQMVFRLLQKQGGTSVDVVAVVKSEVLILGEF
jgi:hypothetical protein